MPRRPRPRDAARRQPPRVRNPYNQHDPEERGQVPPPIGTPPTGTEDPSDPGALPNTSSLGIPGLPPAVAQRAAQIMRDGGDNGVQQALAYIRTTDWYKDEYYGIEFGVANNIFTDVANPEAEYRAYKQSIIQTFRDFYGRIPTKEEIANYLQRGIDALRAQKMGQGYVNTQVHGQDWRYALTAFGETGILGESELDGGLSALGEQQAGINTVLGQKLQDSLDRAMAKVQKVFSGTAGTNLSLEQSLNETATRRRKSDIQL